MSKLKLGELFAGYGGLGMAVEEVFDAELAWYAEFDDAPSKIMAHHWPGVPNHRDVTTVDWSQVEPVDIISGGSPCQDLSAAGRRAGMTEGTRSNLWVSMREAIATIKPTYVVWENVRGAYSAKATSDSDLEPGNGPVGEGSNDNLRALGRVLGDLADLGYDCQWRGLRAADVGAPHGRFRVFLLGTRRESAKNAGCGGIGGRGALPRAGEDRESNVATLGANDRPSSPRPIRRRMEGQATEGRGTDAGIEGRHGHPSAGADGTNANTNDERGNGSGSDQEENRRGEPADSGNATPNSESGRRGFLNGEHERAPGGEVDAPRHEGDATSGASGAPTDWGVYAPAIARWEASRGTAPAPTELTPKGKHRLAAAFAEWMMGLEPGHVTGVPGLTRNEQLKAIGNGVVPQQAIAALKHMLEVNK